METRSFRRITGEVEADTAYIGGRISNMHKSKARKFAGQRGPVGKSIVHGLLERGGRIHVRTMPNEKKAVIAAEISEHVEPGTSVYTDTAGSYHGLGATYAHEIVNHAIEYVRGRVHTNGLENFWSCLKRTIRGTYVAIDPEHLDAYLGEQAWRFNNRKCSDGDRFDLLMQTTIGRRLTRAALTSRGAAT